MCLEAAEDPGAAAGVLRPERDRRPGSPLGNELQLRVEGLVLVVAVADGLVFGKARNVVDARIAKRAFHPGEQRDVRPERLVRAHEAHAGAPASLRREARVGHADQPGLPGDARLGGENWRRQHREKKRSHQKRKAPHGGLFLSDCAVGSYGQWCEVVLDFLVLAATPAAAAAPAATPAAPTPPAPPDAPPAAATPAAALMLLNAAEAAAGSAEAGIAVASAAEVATVPKVPAPSATVPAALVTETAPWRTDTYAGFTRATMKSVPRIPIVACGVRSATACRLRPTIAPEAIRSAPLIRSNTVRSAFASLAS